MYVVGWNEDGSAVPIAYGEAVISMRKGARLTMLPGCDGWIVYNPFSRRREAHSSLQLFSGHTEFAVLIPR